MVENNLILAADIGGTNSRLLLGRLTATGWQPLRQQVFASNAFPTFDALVDVFLQPGEQIRAACLGVAGPVVGQRAAMTHLPWVLDAPQLSTSLGIPVVELLNDFVVQVYGLPVLAAADLLCLQEGEPVPGGAKMLVGAGTGLGIVTFVPSGNGHNIDYTILASEGGHAGFAPQGERQLALHAFLQQRYGRVSLEYVLSGRGLANLYAFVLQERGDQKAAVLTAPEISAAAATGKVDACAALDFFFEIYGDVVGDLALINLPVGGVYITGGIAARLAEQLGSSRLLAHFLDKGLRADVMPQFPLTLVRNDQLGLSGAAERAAQLAGQL